MVSDRLILSIYFLGISLSFMIGVWGYLAIRSDLKHFLQKLTSGSLKGFVWYVVKFGIITMTLVGGMASKYYGCSVGYKPLKESKLELFRALTGQLTGSVDALVNFLLILLSLSFMFFVIIAKSSKGNSDSRGTQLGLPG